MDMAAPRRIKTTCPYCGVGCGVIAEISGTGNVSVRGDESHPANFGRLCSKGAALAETIGLDDRLLYPQVNGAHTDWGSALDLVADKFNAAIREHGPDSVAFYERFVHSQKFAQVDPWSERVSGLHKHEFRPLAAVGVAQAAE